MFMYVLTIWMWPHVSPLIPVYCVNMHVRLLIWLTDQLWHVRLTANKDACGRNLEAWYRKDRPSIISSPRASGRSGSIRQPYVRKLIILSDDCSCRTPTFIATWHRDTATLWRHRRFAECVRVGLHPGARPKSVAITVLSKLVSE